MCQARVDVMFWPKLNVFIRLAVFEQDILVSKRFESESTVGICICAIFQALMYCRPSGLIRVLLFNCKKYTNLTKNIYALGSKFDLRSQFDLRLIKIALKPIRARTLMVLLFLTVDWPTVGSYRSKENTLFLGRDRSYRIRFSDDK